MTALGLAVGVLFLGCVAAHAVLVASLVRRVAWWLVALAAVVPPMAPWWAWAAGVRWRVWTWLGAVVAYAIIVTIAAGGAP